MDVAQQQSQIVQLPKLRITTSAKIPIPVVKHVIKDENDNKEDSQPFDIDKVVKFFVDPHYSTLVNRQLNGVKKICKHFPIGFLMKDVVKIIKILNVLSDKAEAADVENYFESICALLKILQYPFFKEKSSDELVFGSVIVECIANIGYLFRTPNRSVRDEICSCVYNLITFKKIPPVDVESTAKFNSLQRCSKTFVLNCIRHSDLAETLAKSLTLMEDEINVRLKAMKILQLMSKDDMNCEKMLRAECASRIVLKMSYPKPNDELLFRSVEIVWNLLEHGDRDRLVAQLNTLTAINQLKNAFLKQLLQGFSNYDRQLRNDILIISIQLIHVRPTLPFIESGFARDLLNFATYPEIQSNNPLIKSLKLSTCYEDFELKKLFFNFASAISKNSTSYQLLSESGILLALLSFIKPIEKNREARDWTISQFEELQLLAMSVLCILVPLLIPDYLSCHGNNRMLVFLDWCSKDEDDYVGYGNSFHGKGGRGSRKAQLKYCLRMLRSLSTTGNEAALQDLVDQGALESLCFILKLYCSSETRIQQIDVEILGDVFFILSAVCEKDMHRKELFGNDGVDKLVGLLTKRPQLVWNGLGYQSVIISCIDCLWATVVGCVLNEDYFIQKEGVFYLLDILEVAPKSIQNIILGCLLDLSENPKTLTHLLQWEGNQNVKIAHFLCELWRIEERDTNVERDENGFILNTSEPLRSADSETSPTSMPADVPSRAIVEISENMRAKIYGLFCKLGFSDLSGITNEDQITLCIIENYLDFKLGEVFKEINNELEIDEIKPISPDQEAFENILRSVEDRVVNVAMTQKSMATTFDEQETIQEREFYYEIKKNFSTKERRQQDWRDYMERVSKYSTLMAAKDRQLAAIDDSRPSEREPLPFETLHNLEIPNLAVTAFAGPYITIDSTPAEITGGRIAKILNN